jgi:hypothetical protein
MNEGTDYKQVLDELIADREKLDMMIEWVKLRLGRTDSESNAPRTHLVKTAESVRVTKLASDAFFRMNVSEAIKAYLSFAKKPQTAREITDALIEGGLSFKAKNLYQTVFPTLSRMATEGGEVAKLKDGKWGLSEWYSPTRRTVTETPAESESQ